MEELAYIRANLAAVEADLSAIAARTGRPKATLVAVTKSASDAEVLALCRAGVTAIAENRVPLYRARRELLAAQGLSLPLHLIGSLQTNKVKYIAEDVALVQSLDSLHLADVLEQYAARYDRRLPVLCEVNSGREENKGGLMPEEVMPFLARLRQGEHPHLQVAGLMTMGPVCENEEALRPYFRQTRVLYEACLRDGAFAAEAPILSMGMSGSYRVAAEEGATMVRVGRRLFFHPPGGEQL